jgi:hypothetical protein
MNLDDLLVVHLLDGDEEIGFTSPASPADILPRLGFTECDECEGRGQVKRQGDISEYAVPCPSCRGGWIPGGSMVERFFQAWYDEPTR